MSTPVRRRDAEPQRQDVPRSARRGRLLSTVDPVRWRDGVNRLVVAAMDAPSRDTVARRDATFRRSLVVADGLAALAALWIAVMVLGDDRLRWASLLVAPLVVLGSKLKGLYDRDELVLRKSTLDDVTGVFELATLMTLAIWLLEDVVLNGRLRPAQTLGLWASLFGLTLAARLAARHAAGRVASPERCLVVGDHETSLTLGRKVANASSGRAQVVSSLPLRLERQYDTELVELERAVRQHEVDRVILAPHSADTDAMLDAIRLSKGLGVKVSILPRLFEVVGSSVVFDDVQGTMVLGVRRFGLSRSSRMLKRSLDLVVAGVGVLAVSPLLAGIALWVRLDSRGPILFRQQRVGRDGHRFDILKFRTMVPDAEALKGELRVSGRQDLFKLADDPRITRAGRLLRRTSLDELPQLLNVLRGDMSLVGPRPLVLDEDALVRGFDRRRLHLTPGMTGPWQVLGATRVPLREMVKIDYLYIANWSFAGDVKILARTVLHVLRGGGL